MAGCDVLYFDPTQAGQPRDRAGHPLGPPGDGCGRARPPAHLDRPRPGAALDLRQASPLAGRPAYAGPPDQVRWQRPGLATGPALAQEATP